ncbi:MULTISPECIES: ABC transporter permease [Mesorhizobium]|uniref:Binding-protein-dependent transport systems inner membrane component n=1 Tax=Mesorhizobium ciceri biovar biserrulae (strain HAMBI 2942 / LMG 23838 / WSM1271) TaxID=765698 RepID=E8TB53_MESCW|nr:MULTISPECIES: ABC transporter permease [Mesorhizobium]RUZ83740.1 ABC transporter permease [Mesorhizobium sp. M7A.F.Ca.US.003.02.2.1]ADV14322.1 binding-protein-dependent transport systems inner membrane component [Mesorhizobium ciceri biovar biserrulae WSM1271]RUY99687.1 ABC transporter permease [Mesorhizobium sp. M7A.F.Ca.CA.001.12.2.1]RUZ19030.1 ABC transporter permease [Mesorhizobium sp. M7A.F.Ca.US.007.01.2.1]RUZ49657.1 ABC transporter permease [Mesorhizobium sp. M7A.F.Ca.US.003.02.1.1]
MSEAGSTLPAEKRLSLLVTVLAFALPVVFVLVPLAIFLGYSFFSVDQGTIVYGFSLGNYVRFFTDPVFLPVFWNTIVLCVSVAIVCILLAYPAAYFLTTLKGRWRYALLMLLLVPLLMSYVIKIYAIRSILGLNGFLNKALVALGILQEPSTLFVFNMNAILLTLTLLLIPFAILPIFLSLERIPQVLLRASDDLGASGLQTFLRITLPLSLPGVASAASFVFVLAIGDFLTPQMVGGISGFTFGRILYSQFGTAYNWPFGAALSVALAVVVIAAILIGERFGRNPGTSA